MSYTLSANVENLYLLDGALNGTGSADANKIYGNDLANALDGGAGNDTLDGGAGIDKLTGGAGNDTFIFYDADTVVEAAGGGTDEVRSALASYVLAAMLRISCCWPALSAAPEMRSITSLPAMQTPMSSMVGAGNDTLDGGAGADAMTGGVGNDIYYVDSSLDTVTELAGGGTDEVRSTVNYQLGSDIENLVLLGSAVSGTGNGLANTITGNALNNVLDGGLGADKLVGGLGNDSYFVDNTADVVTEAANQGTDTVFQHGGKPHACTQCRKPDAAGCRQYQRHRQHRQQRHQWKRRQ